jgi:hypothetical protein
LSIEGQKQFDFVFPLAQNSCSKLFLWSCRESNPGPNKLPISFLHA